MRLIVTGAAGFIGSHVTERLLAEGHAVVGVDNLTTGRLSNLADAMTSDRFSIQQIDIGDPQLVDTFERARPEVICHLAAQVDVRASVADPMEDVRQNVLGSVNVMQAAQLAGCRKIVFASSGGAMYGNDAPIPVKESFSGTPASPYAASKAACELYLSAFGELYGIDWISLALANVYGPRQDSEGEAGVVAMFTAALMNGRPTSIYGDGTSTRDYIFVEDVATAFCKAVQLNRRSNRRYNIGTGNETSIRQLHELIASTLHRPNRPQMRPPRLGEIQSIALDCTDAASELGWRSATDLHSGIARTVQWLQGRQA